MQAIAIETLDDDRLQLRKPRAGGEGGDTGATGESELSAGPRGMVVTRAGRA
jgi:hypothetical protein